MKRLPLILLLSWPLFASASGTPVVQETEATSASNGIPHQIAAGYETGNHAAPESTYVTSVTSSVTSGLLTHRGEAAGNFDTITVNFNQPVTVTGTPTLTLNSTSTPVSYSGGSPGTSLTFNYSVGASDGTPIAASTTNPTGNTYLATGTLSLSGGSINDTATGTPALLAGAGGVIFSGVAVNTNPIYFVSPTGTDTGNGTTACRYSSPCATINFVSRLMAANSTKTTYLLPGTYKPSPVCAFPTTNRTPAGGDTAKAILCLNSTSDNGTSYLGYPNPKGPLGVVVTGGATSASTGVQAAINVGTNYQGCSTGPSDITFNGFTIRNFSWEGFRLNCTGGVITVSNMVLGNFYMSAFCETCVGNDGGGPIAVDSGWTKIYISHNFIYNTGVEGITGPKVDQANDGKDGAQPNGYYIVDGNILINTCNTGYDCGALYGRDATLTLNNGAWTNNIIETVGSPSLVTNCLYLDDYDSHMTVTGNVCAGIGFMGVLIHGGASNTLSNNLFDMSVTFAAKGTNNANPLYYQDNNIYHGSEEFPCPSYPRAGCLVNGYGGTMDNNSLTGNIYYTTVAPPGLSCDGSVGCGYVYVWEAEDWPHPYPTKNPKIEGNNWWYTGGPWPSESHFRSHPSQSSPTYGPIGDSNPILTDPQITTTTRSYNGINYTIYNVGNPPPGWTPLRTDQGPH